MSITAGVAATRDRTAADLATQPWRPFRIVVAALRRLSPTFLRITFTGDDLDQFGHDGPDQRIKLYIPRPGHGIPDFSPTDWYAQYRSSNPRTRGSVRTYTIRDVRPEARELDVDFVLHGHAEASQCGPAATWAAGASVGDELVVIGPNRLYPTDSGGHEWHPPAAARDVLIAGDETAIPAIGAILETLRSEGRPGLAHPARTAPATPAEPASPATRIRVFLEVPSPDDVLDLTAPDHAQVTWLSRLRRDGTSVPHGELLVNAVTSLEFEEQRSSRPDPSMVDTVDIDLEVLWEVAASASSHVYAWVAGEAGAVKTIRRHLVRERGIDKGAVTFMGYWRLGRSLDD